MKKNVFKETKGNFILRSLLGSEMLGRQTTHQAQKCPLLHRQKSFRATQENR